MKLHDHMFVSSLDCDLEQIRNDKNNNDINVNSLKCLTSSNKVNERD